MSKFDSYGREVLASDWNALQDIPALVAALGNLTMTDGGIIVATSSTALANLSPGDDGEVLTLVSGSPAWASASASIGQVYANQLGSDASLSTSAALVGSVAVNAAGTYYIEAFLSIVDSTASGTATTSAAYTVGTGAIPSPAAGYVRVINNLESIENYYAHILDASGIGLYAGDDIYVQGDGVVAVTDPTTIELYLTLSAGAATCKAPSLMRATRVS